MLQEQTAFKRDVCGPLLRTNDLSSSFNADETAVYYDEDPGKIISEKGRNKGAKVKGRPRSGRASVLLTIFTSGAKLKPLIIFRGASGETVEDELAAFTPAALYTVQRKAWMDTRV